MHDKKTFLPGNQPLPFLLLQNGFVLSDFFFWILTSATGQDIWDHLTYSASTGALFVKYTYV